MTIDEVETAVTEWLDKRDQSGWFAETLKRVLLLNMTRTCIEQFGVDSPPAIGCLYALMREAWDTEYVVVEEFVSVHRGGCLELRKMVDGEWRRVFLGSGGTRLGRILAALERAP